MEEKQEFIENSINKLTEAMPAIESDLYDIVLSSTLKMDLENYAEGTLVVEKMLIDSLKKSGYPSKVTAYLRDYQAISRINKTEHARINDINLGALDDLLDPLQKQQVQLATNMLRGGGMQTNYLQPLRELIVRTVLFGTSVNETKEVLSLFIKGNPTQLGALNRYITQISNDLISQFDGMIQDTVRTEYDMEYLRYVGSIIKTTRPQCVRWVGMDYLKVSELSKEIAWAQNNGTGLNKYITPETFCAYRGGYNCRHIAYPVRKID